MLRPWMLLEPGWLAAWDVHAGDIIKWWFTSLVYDDTHSKRKQENLYLVYQGTY